MAASVASGAAAWVALAAAWEATHSRLRPPRRGRQADHPTPSGRPRVRRDLHDAADNGAPSARTRSASWIAWSNCLARCGRRCKGQSRRPAAYRRTRFRCRRCRRTPSGSNPEHQCIPLISMLKACGRHFRRHAANARPIGPPRPKAPATLPIRRERRVASVASVRWPRPPRLWPSPLRSPDFFLRRHANLVTSYVRSRSRSFSTTASLCASSCAENTSVIRPRCASVRSRSNSSG